MTLRNHCQKAGRSTSAPERAAPESYIAELFPHKPPMAEPQIAVLKVIVSAQFFSSCYFKVQLLHNVTLMSVVRASEPDGDGQELPGFRKWLFNYSQRSLPPELGIDGFTGIDPAARVHCSESRRRLFNLTRVCVCVCVCVKRSTRCVCVERSTKWVCVCSEVFDLWSTCCFQALPYVCLLIAMLFFIYAIIGMQVRRRRGREEKRRREERRGEGGSLHIWFANAFSFPRRSACSQSDVSLIFNFCAHFWICVLHLWVSVRLCIYWAWSDPVTPPPLRSLGTSGWAKRRR